MRALGRVPGRARRSVAPALALALVLLLGTGRTPADPAPSTDPMIPYSTLLGGSGGEYASAVSLGPDGTLWIAALSSSGDFPGAPRPGGAPAWPELVVLRFDPVRRAILSSVWLGVHTGALAIAFDGAGNAFLAGGTGERGLPVTAGLPTPPPTASDRPDTNIWMARIRSDGTGVDWFALFGGAGEDRLTGLAVSPEGDPIVLGTTESADFPTASPLQGSRLGSADAFLARIRGDGGGFVFSTFLGGSDSEGAGGLAVLPGGDILVTGSTYSTDFPGTERLFGIADDGDGFIAEIDAAGTEVRRTARIGGTRADGILMESPDSLVLWGWTWDDAFPLPTGRDSRAFLLRLSVDDWSVLGGSLPDVDYPIAASRGADGTIWLTTRYYFFGGAATPGAARPFPMGAGDAFAAAFSAEDLSQVYGTYLGGRGWDDGPAVAAAEDGSAWFLGSTMSPDFPLVPPEQAAPPHGEDLPAVLFLARLRAGDPASRPGTPTDLAATALDNGTARLSWEAGPGDESGFAVYRHGSDTLDANSYYHEVAVDRIAVLPAGTREWVDAGVVSDRRYSWSVQAIHDSGGSAPSAEATIDLPPTLAVAWKSGTFCTRRSCGPYNLRLRGTLTGGPSASDGALDPRRSGFEWAETGYEYYIVDRFSIPPDDPGWRESGGRIRWTGEDLRLDFDPATGAFDLRVRGYLRIGIDGGAALMEFTVGHRSGTTFPLWEAVGPRTGRFRAPHHFRIP